VGEIKGHNYEGVIEKVLLKMEKKIEIYLDIAKRVGVFKPAELAVLKEVLEDYYKNPQSSYCIFDERKEDKIIGFVIFGKASLTDFSWDIYWLIVGKDSQGKGFGKRLIKRIEEFIFTKYDRAVLRVETSLKKEYLHARNLYQKMGFSKAGEIPNFYSKEDSLIIYCKEIIKS